MKVSSDYRVKMFTMEPSMIETEVNQWFERNQDLLIEHVDSHAFENWSIVFIYYRRRQVEVLKNDNSTG